MTTLHRICNPLTGDWINSPCGVAAKKDVFPTGVYSVIAKQEELALYTKIVNI